jgi:FkbM family methyltransferase
MTWFKSGVRLLLNKIVHRDRFNDSRMYRRYVRLRYPEAAKGRDIEQQFYQQALGTTKANLIFDIGANVGRKAAIFLPLAERIICVEPDPTAIKALQQRFLHRPKITVVPKGVDAAEGTAKFHMFDEADSYNTFSAKWADTLTAPSASDRQAKTAKAIVNIPVTTLDHLIAEFGKPYYIKIDVEGYELSVLKGLSHVVPLISFECNLPEFLDETTECLSLLANRSTGAVFNYCTTEPPAGFESPQWLNAAQMADVVRSGKHSFMEIYCRSV